MQAAIMSKIGNLNYLSFNEIATPLPTDNEALIKIEYCGLNHLDLLIIEGKRTGPKNFPHILGSEFVGIIVKVNSNNHNFKIGDRVAVYPWTYCGKCVQCKEGNENICDNGGTFGRNQWGGFAEFATVPIKNLIIIPKDLSPKLVCASILSSTTAYHMIERANIKNNSSVLITGATGGVGTSAIQILRRKKCLIIGTTSHNEKAKKLKSLGVDQVVGTNNRVREVDYVIEIMGGKVWSSALEDLKKNGTMVFCSTTLQEEGQVNIVNAFAKQLNILGSCGGTIKDLKGIIKLLQKGVIRPVIDSVYPLEKTKEALIKLSEQKAFGKILLNPSI